MRLLRAAITWLPRLWRLSASSDTGLEDDFDAMLVLRPGWARTRRKRGSMRMRCGRPRALARVAASPEAKPARMTKPTWTTSTRTLELSVRCSAVGTPPIPTTRTGTDPVPGPVRRRRRGPRNASRRCTDAITGWLFPRDPETVREGPGAGVRGAQRPGVRLHDRPDAVHEHGHTDRRRRPAAALHSVPEMCSRRTSSTRSTTTPRCTSDRTTRRDARGGQARGDLCRGVRLEHRFTSAR